MSVLFRIFTFLIGACVGSFLCCQARRMRIKETTKGKHKKSLGHRSICLHCKKQLKWYDNLPILSWLILRGKCRYCHKKIGILEFLSELGTAIAFLLVSFTIDPTTATAFEWGIFAVAIILTAIFAFLAIYDGVYGELPSLCLMLSIMCAIVLLSIRIWSTLLLYPFTPSLILDPLLAVVILGGIYLALYLVSKGKWVGDGDWLLGVAIALALGTPWLALVALFLSNIIACLVMYPVIKFKSHKTHSAQSTPHVIHLGPFLVTAFVLVYSFSSYIMAII